MRNMAESYTACRACVAGRLICGFERFRAFADRPECIFSYYIIGLRVDIIIARAKKMLVRWYKVSICKIHRFLPAADTSV